ncbi:hypothetical protein EMIT0373P_20698 [Pseudomonas chlororaphis]
MPDVLRPLLTYRFKRTALSPLLSDAD